MKLAALFSGGKDSTFAILKARQMGHTVSCLVTVVPHSAESHLLHHPNIVYTKLQAESMGLPHLVAVSKGPGDEGNLLKSLLSDAKERHSVGGVVHGGILSEFQKKNFERVAEELGLQVVVPLWKADQKQYMRQLIDSGFEFIVSSVSCDGLDESWLGKTITGQDLGRLELLSERYRFNLSFEGGEAETFVLNCPLFEWPIQITQSQRHWDGYRGTIEILDAKILR